MKAVKIQPGQTVAVEEAPIPDLLEGQLLVKVAAVAVNPTDWKHVEYGFGGGVGSTVGCDLAGTVEKVGPNSRFVPGERVAGVTHGCSKLCPSSGAFAEYVAVEEHGTLKLPDRIAFEDAASLGVALATTALSLYYHLGLPLSLEPTRNGEPILVYGGATTVAQVVIQLAKLAGLTVITTASEKNRDYLTKLGADHVIDYHDADKCIADIKAVLSGRELKLAHDSISDGDSFRIVFSSVTPGPDTKVTLVNNPRETTVPAGVSAFPMLAYLLNGREIEFLGQLFPANQELAKFAARFMVFAEQAIAEGKLTTQEIRRLPGGLEGVKDALAQLKSQGDRAKLVLTVS